ncbi:MAG TPA: tetraacyldisaccharide 4'-kinase [Steroidobacteraceae bacterium]|nr:tetraacyldisaccharide 4'-kinase [Steroidobacteraceae bacterium]
MESVWYRERPPAWLLPLAILYGAAMALRRWSYAVGLLRSGAAGIPVIVVGNLTAGGTGKTPLVLWLVAQLQLAGWRVGIVSRGYGAARRLRTPRVVADDDANAVGDEAVLLARRAECPVCVCVDRLAAARQLADLGCQVVVADDGLQHLALRRDAEIVVIDGARMFGNGALLPAGPLREPTKRLAGIDAVVFNGAARFDLPAAGEIRSQMSLRPEQFVHLADGGASAVQDWSGRSVHAVAGIGNPARFFATLRELGLRPVEHAFADHHAFAAEDLAFGDTLPIVMTEKDAVKCGALATDRMWCLRVTAQFEHDDAARLLTLLQARLTGKR